ncbi:MAG TPA: 3-dehydroquinate synthase [Bryobacteraceae bacterium]|nr:3-dehydroquinate synthase [Bryobacteraceae bacterium]
MPCFEVTTAQRRYRALVERGILARAGDYVPQRAGKLFVITTEDVWSLHGRTLARGLEGLGHEVLFFHGGEDHKRLAEVERLAGEMVERGGDRSSIVLAFGGGVVDDVAGFVAAVFMRGIPVIQAPTTLLAQVDAGVGGKAGVNLVSGKNLVGAFHQPLVVLTDPDVLATLAEREYRAGIYEVIKCGVIRSESLFRLMSERRHEVLARAPAAVDEMIAESVRIKAAVVSADERESDLRRILNFGHTYGHALEAETGYVRFLHGEAVAFGMKAAVHLARLSGLLAAADARSIIDTVDQYGPIPSIEGIRAENLVARLAGDKKTLRGRVHFVLPVKIGDVKIVSGIEESMVLAAARAALE